MLSNGHHLNSLLSKPRDMAISNKTTGTTNACSVLWSTWHVFYKRTNIIGICNASSSNSGFRSKIWMAIFATFAALTFTGLKDVIDEIMSYPVITLVTVENRNQVHKTSFFQFNIAI